MKVSRKRPVVETWQYSKDNWRYKPTWLSNAIETGRVWMQGGASPYLTIKTPRGEVRVEPGDWIILGVGGGLCVCPPGIFEATYEPA